LAFAERSKLPVVCSCKFTIGVHNIYSIYAKLCFEFLGYVVKESNMGWVFFLWIYCIESFWGYINRIRLFLTVSKDKLNWKVKKICQFLKLKRFLFSSNFIASFCCCKIAHIKESFLWIIEKNYLFYNEKGAQVLIFRILEGFQNLYFAFNFDVFVCFLWTDCDKGFS
jgi:hypothetical protein